MTAVQCSGEHQRDHRGGLLFDRRRGRDLGPLGATLGAASWGPMALSLRRNRSFLLLWGGQSISQLGSQVSNLALPLTATLFLHASPFELGLLGTLELLPYLLFGLLAGAWADRRTRRPILVAADLGRAAVLGAVPLLAMAGQLRMEHLYVIGALVGLLGVFFSVAYGAYLPALIPPEQLMAGNSRLALSESLSRVVGPSLAGVLVQVLTAPLAIAADAVSFVASAVSLWAVPIREDAPRPPTAQSLLGDVREGVRWVFHHSLVGPLAVGGAVLNLGDGMFFANSLYVLFATRELGLPPSGLGVVVSALGIGGLVGAAVMGPVTRWAGLGACLVGATLLPGAGLLALNAAPRSVAIPALVGALAVLGAVNPIFGSTSIALRQAVTPRALLGRVNATVRVMTWGSLPVGSLIGGVLASHYGLRSALLVAGVLEVVCSLYFLASPVRGVRTLPAATPPNSV